MLFAERHGKLGRDGSRVHDRAEDLLTSTVFQLLRYLPPHDGLFAVLNRVRAVRWDGVRAVVDSARPAWLSALDSATDYKLTFWLHWGKDVGQPELVIELKSLDKPLARFLVEVKLDSGKSQLADDEPGQPEPAPAKPKDQLFRYWNHLAGLNNAEGFPPGGLVYLTAHATPPLDDLAESLRQQPAGGRCDWLGWLSWRGVWSEMRAASKHYLPAADLADILAAKRLKGFDGFEAVKRGTVWRPPAGPCRFWSQVERRWFATPKPDQFPAHSFWTHSEERK